MNKPFYHHLYFYVLLAIACGIGLGIANPAFAKELKVLNDVFLRIIKMIVAPVIFITVTLGISHLKDFKKAGSIGLKAIIYFEVVTTLALLIGLLVMNVIRPGEGMNKTMESLDPSKVEHLVKKGQDPFIYKIIPSSVFQPFIEGEILQVLFLAIVSGVALALLQEKGEKITETLEAFSRVLYKMVSLLMCFAPIGAFGAMAYTIGTQGTEALAKMGNLLLCVYLTCILFIAGILGGFARLSGFSLLKFLRYIKDEILTVLGTSSSESVLPDMIRKMERLGCSPTVTRLVISTGYSFNLDGTSIYLTMAALFIAQALNIPLSLEQQIFMMGMFMLTSKGAAAVTGGGLVTLAATFSAIDTLPVAGIYLVLGIDRFMSEARAITNLIGNGVATLTISNWEKETDLDKLQAELDQKR